MKTSYIYIYIFFFFSLHPRIPISHCNLLFHKRVGVTLQEAIDTLYEKLNAEIYEQ